MKKVWIIIAIMILLFGIGAYLIFSNGNNASSNNQYQALNAPGAVNNSALQQTAGKYSGLDLTPGQPQTDIAPSASTDIPSP
jgi:hypothetical protein